MRSRRQSVRPGTDYQQRDVLAACFGRPRGADRPFHAAIMPRITLARNMRWWR
jgi:hypothetical protein